MRLALTPGMGVGPEVACRALATLRARDPAWVSRVALVGRAAPLREHAAFPLVAVGSMDEAAAALGGEAVPVLEPSDEAEPLEVAALRLCVAACLEGGWSGLVTGPIHKARLAARGFAYMGHTDFLGALCGVDEPVMAFAGGDLRVALVTVHVSLRQVPGLLTSARIARVARLAWSALRDDLGLAAPRLGVCGLNPHAGEGGLLGTEEQEIIGPACEALRAEGLEVVGPVSAETAFLEARAGRLDLVVAMYHDQGLAPLKAVDFGRSVNWTLGLPILRTSVDHGTADALVGTGRADPSSMVAALDLAARVAAHRAAAPVSPVSPVSDGSASSVSQG